MSMFPERKQRILIIEPDYFLASGIQENLEEENYTALAAKSYDDALAILHAFCPDVLVISLINNREWSQHFSDYCREIYPICYMVSILDSYGRRRLQLGENDCILTFPCLPEDLLEMLAHMLKIGSDG